jgi:arylsulfatase A-like enzyme
MLAELERCGELANTLVIVTSDNGMPFPRVKGNMYDDDFRLPMAMMWQGRASANDGSAAAHPAPTRRGVVLEDMISFTDIAPTLLEAAGVPFHPQMSGRSFLSVLDARESGLFDPTRNRVCMGRERHDLGREDDLGYPVRCIRTPQYLYVRNFAPDRWPAGNPETGFTGCDSSPTKDAILSLHAEGPSTFFEWSFGKRPSEELFDIKRDPECMKNLATDPAFGTLTAQLWCELESYLRAQGDPRIFGNGAIFEEYEYVGDSDHSWKAYEEGRWKPQRY